MKIVLWHGYLLNGTGSNVYSRALARAWSNQSHDVTVICQERHPERFDLGGATVVRPDIGEILPVFVLDRYEGLEARLIQDLDRAALDHFVEVNAAAIREHLPADLVFTNHLLLGSPVGAATGVPYVVKAHGSELEFSMRGNPQLCAWARQTLASATRIYAGTAHIQRVIEDVVGPGPHLERVRVMPPGVDTDEFRPRPRHEALAGLVAQAEHDAPNPDRRFERLPDHENAPRFARFFASDQPTVVYVGKLSEEKGVHLLLEALPRIGARAVIVGFGPAREALEEQARGMPVLFTGPLEHRHLVHLLPLCDASVVPSIFPEAFGMVAAEAAACGVPPIVARHSGLAEIAAGLESEYPPALRDLAAFTSGSVDELADRLRRISTLPDSQREQLARAARKAVVDRWSWAFVSRRIAADDA